MRYVPGGLWWHHDVCREGACRLTSMIPPEASLRKAFYYFDFGSGSLLIPHHSYASRYL
jgi:hypothetical protein